MARLSIDGCIASQVSGLLFGQFRSLPCYRQVPFLER
jgi:hypothetical protein